MQDSILLQHLVRNGTNITTGLWLREMTLKDSVAKSQSLALMMCPAMYTKRQKIIHSSSSRPKADDVICKLPAKGVTFGSDIISNIVMSYNIRVDMKMNCLQEKLGYN